VNTIFYFSGHGFEKHGAYYLILNVLKGFDPHDTNNSIYLETVIEFLSKAVNGIKMVIVDACRARIADTESPGDEKHKIDVKVDINYYKSKFTSNTFMAYSTSPNANANISSVSSLSAGSDYTNALVKYLDSKKGHTIKVQDMFYFIREELKYSSQIPMENNNLENIDYLLDNIF